MIETGKRSEARTWKSEGGQAIGRSWKYEVKDQMKEKRLRPRNKWRL